MAKKWQLVIEANTKEYGEQHRITERGMVISVFLKSGPIEGEYNTVKCEGEFLVLYGHHQNLLYVDMEQIAAIQFHPCAL